MRTEQRRQALAELLLHNMNLDGVYEMTFVHEGKRFTASIKDV